MNRRLTATAYANYAKRMPDLWSDTEPATITALVPTYRRPRDLARCLEALRAQVRLPDEVLVVVRDEDAETRDLLTKFDPEGAYSRVGCRAGTRRVLLV